MDHLDLEVAYGEAFALVGPDAAGKTTTMRLLVGIMDPDEGRAEVLGFDTVKESERLKEQIGYMPQRFGLYDDLTVAENIAFYADIYQVDRAARDRRMPELLGFSNLTPFTDRLARNLSGGMRQKLGLVCALIHTPRLLFLDEPTFGVDPVSRREFWEILYRLLGGGLTIFLSTAYMDEAERAHRVGLDPPRQAPGGGHPQGHQKLLCRRAAGGQGLGPVGRPQGPEQPPPGAAVPGHGGPADADGGQPRPGRRALDGGAGGRPGSPRSTSPRRSPTWRTSSSRSCGSRKSKGRGHVAA